MSGSCNGLLLLLPPCRACGTTASSTVAPSLTDASVLLAVLMSLGAMSGPLLPRPAPVGAVCAVLRIRARAQVRGFTAGWIVAGVKNEPTRRDRNTISQRPCEAMRECHLPVTVPDDPVTKCVRCARPLKAATGRFDATPLEPCFGGTRPARREASAASQFCPPAQGASLRRRRRTNLSWPSSP